MSAQLQGWATILGGVTAAAAILGFIVRRFTRPLWRLLDALGPLTDKNSDGKSVFDEMRFQQKEDSAALAHLAAEFPKNGVPTRSTVDALKLMVGEIQVKQADVAATLAEVKAAQEAHVTLHLAGAQTPQQRRRTS